MTSRDPNDPLEQLAQTWEYESAAMQLEPNRDTPPDIIKRRLRDFWKAWGLKEKTVDEPTPKG